MALSTAERKQVARWFVRKVFQKDRLPAVIDRVVLFTAIDAGDAWVDAAPAGGASNGAAFKSALDVGFTGAFTAPFVVNDAVAMLFAGIGLGRAGAL